MALEGSDGVRSCLVDDSPQAHNSSMKARLVTAVATVSMLIVAAGCGTGTENDEPRIANPAAVFCEDQGGTTSGPEPMCELPDGSVVDAWSYFRENGLAG
jgi:putative hemolysin